MKSSIADRTILLNATTINKGGGVQAVVSFICLLIDQFQCNDGARWIFAGSGEVRDELAGFGHALRGGIDLCLEHSPAKSWRSRRELREFAGQNADLVFTFFGPAYVAFRCPHICGVADAWVTHSTKLAYSRLPTLSEKLHIALLSVYKGLWFRRADCWVVEHEAARSGLINRVRLPPGNIYVVSNNCGRAYLDEKRVAGHRALQSTIRVLTFAANYPHKCLDLIPQIAAQLVREHNINNVQFVLTVPAEEYVKSMIAIRARALGVERHVCNVGFVALKDGPALYRSCDIVLMPSVLETFSATYPESMSMGLPIVTSNLEFARSVCRDAALYFEPLDVGDAARLLASLIKNHELRASLIAAGYKRVRDFPSPMERYSQFKAIVNRLMTAPVDVN
jgi:glycosyltransferase involved in cell wall biosynthesis